MKYFVKVKHPTGVTVYPELINMNWDLNELETGYSCFANGEMIPWLEFDCPACKFKNLMEKWIADAEEVTATFCTRCGERLDITRGY